MSKIGRNDPCSCGSGKKYKACCLAKKSQPRKIKAKWLSGPKKEEGPNLMERTFGKAVTEANEKPPIAPTPPPTVSKEEDS